VSVKKCQSALKGLFVAARWPLIVFALLLEVAGCASVSSTSDNGVRRMLNSHDAAYVKSGDGALAIVLQAGLGDGKEVWETVFEDLASKHTVFAYDRPGYGGMPATQTARDPCSIATELRDQLRAAKLSPPYVLVGHSLGGLYQYVFSRLYPQEVAGLVLLDPTHPRHWQRMQQDAPSAAKMVKAMNMLAFNSTMRREFEAQATCLDRIDATQTRAIPTRFLVSARFTSVEKGEFESMVKTLRLDWLRLTNAARLDVISDAGHYIQKDSPQDVVAAVAGALAEMKKGSQ
jgi:pimeloyl-ACP methyl ester carboxylesterase